MGKQNKQKPKIQQSASGNTVIVCLKHPQGISFDLLRDNSGNERRVVINGNADELRGAEKGILPTGGYGMTEVAKDDWEQIKKLYGSMRIFKSGLIFASGSVDNADDKSDECDEIKNGMEPAAPEDAGVAEAVKEA